LQFPRLVGGLAAEGAVGAMVVVEVLPLLAPPLNYVLIQGTTTSSTLSDAKNPNGYCRDHGTGVACVRRRGLPRSRYERGPWESSVRWSWAPLIHFVVRRSVDEYGYCGHADEVVQTRSRAPQVPTWAIGRNH
jgi:hypothetical protein